MEVSPTLRCCSWGGRGGSRESQVKDSKHGCSALASPKPVAGPPVEPQWVTDRIHTQVSGAALSLLSPFLGCFV